VEALDVLLMCTTAGRGDVTTTMMLLLLPLLLPLMSLLLQL
jgi:hypothetical protein